MHLAHASDCLRPPSLGPDLLSNTTIIAHGSVLDSSLNARILSYVDFVEAPVTAGFCSFVRAQTKKAIAASLLYTVESFRVLGSMPL
jgi:hypothetical protein